MAYVIQTQAATLAEELLSPAWLLAEPMLTRINRSSTGIGLFKAARRSISSYQGYSPQKGEIVDFYYELINPVLQAIARATLEDCCSLPLSALIPEGVQTDLIPRMIRVVETGQPNHHHDIFNQEGIIMCHDQLCLKAGDGVLVLVMDVTYLPLSAEERRQRTALIQAIKTNAFPGMIRSQLSHLID